MVTRRSWCLSSMHSQHPYELLRTGMWRKRKQSSSHWKTRGQPHCYRALSSAAALFVDFKTAFNQLWYHGLCLKLTRLCCPLEKSIGWLRHYRSRRSAYMEIKGSRSPTFLQHKGVLQGSCIGPVLFILYHHDVLVSLTNPQCSPLLLWYKHQRDRLRRS